MDEQPATNERDDAEPRTPSPSVQVGEVNMRPARTVQMAPSRSARNTGRAHGRMVKRDGAQDNQGAAAAVPTLKLTCRPSHARIVTGCTKNATSKNRDVGAVRCSALFARYMAYWRLTSFARRSCVAESINATSVSRPYPPDFGNPPISKIAGPLKLPLRSARQ